MLVKTKAIVLTSLKYGESDLIVKCFTEEGAKTYLLKRILKSKSKKINIAYFQPLTQLRILANHNNRGTLNSIKEAGISYLYQTISTNVFKQASAFFLAEILTSSLYEEEKNPRLFQYIETALIWLDTHDKTSNFHILFLLNLSKYLGFYPEMKEKNSLYFDLSEGYFTDAKPLNSFISGEKLILFKSLIGINFDVIGKLQLNSKSRAKLLDILLEYYELHLSGFRKPKSLNVLKEVFE
ncbi:MAG: DNA repair protein RecO [Flavobacteriaceae bacterium]|nr:DNA repair protein RecO [Flavobacteriaceae bacterium]